MFQKGDRVRLAAWFIKDRFHHKDRRRADPKRLGTVTRVGQRFPYLLSVQWDGNKNPDYPNPDTLEVVHAASEKQA
jgi:hypothetical protein